MRRRTTTQKLQQVITNNLLHITKAEVYYKTSRKTENVEADTFKDSLDFICETIFADSIGWHYERDYKTNAYIAECGRMNPDIEIIISVYLRVADDVNGEDIERTLKIEEE